jgi:hypothetical protein
LISLKFFAIKSNYYKLIIMSLNHSLAPAAFTTASGEAYLGGRLEVPKFGNTSVQAFSAGYITTAKTANYTVSANDFWIPVNTTGGVVTVTLPAAAAPSLLIPGPNQGQMFIVTDASGTAGTNNITVSAGVGTTLVGLAGAGTISTNRDSRRYIYVGTVYYQI